MNTVSLGFDLVKELHFPVSLISLMTANERTPTLPSTLMNKLKRFGNDPSILVAMAKRKKVRPARANLVFFSAIVWVFVYRVFRSLYLRFAQHLLAVKAASV